MTFAPAAALRSALADRYDIDRAIGEGGMATVWLAADRKHGRDVAIKVRRPEIAASLGAERLLREIRIAALQGEAGEAVRARRDALPPSNGGIFNMASLGYVLAHDGHRTAAGPSTGSSGPAPSGADGSPISRSIPSWIRCAGTPGSPPSWNE